MLATIRRVRCLSTTLFTSHARYHLLQPHHAYRTSIVHQLAFSQFLSLAFYASLRIENPVINNYHNHNKPLEGIDYPTRPTAISDTSSSAKTTPAIVARINQDAITTIKSKPRERQAQICSNNQRQPASLLRSCATSMSLMFRLTSHTYLPSTKLSSEGIGLLAWQVHQINNTKILSS